MKTFPMFLKMAGRRVVILGGGEQAAQKARLVLKTEAELVVRAPDLDPELEGLVAEGRMTHCDAPVTVSGLEGCALAFVATGCPGLDAALADLVRAARVPVNVVDQPELCDAFTPSIVDRDPVVVAIGTEGTAPILGRLVKTGIEQMLEPRLGHLAALAGRLRPAVAQGVARNQRRAFWRWVFDGTPRKLHASGAERDAARALKAAIAEGRAPDTQAGGEVAVIPVAQQASDLLTLRAVRKLQECDVIYHGPSVPAGVLELARRDAERVVLGQGGHDLASADRAAALVLAEARKGRQVVYLTRDSRAASLLERQAEGSALRIEFVPGVTDPSAPQPATAHSA